MPRLLAALVLVLATAAPASAQSRGVVHQQLVLLLNPMGMQHQLDVGLRAPLGDQGALLFDGAHAEAGITSRVAPVFAIHGGYLEVSPLSFLVLRAEMAGAVVWPIGMDGAGYYGLEGYGADFDAQHLPGAEGGEATGWTVRLSGQLQGAIPLGDAGRLLIADRMTFQHDDQGDAAFYYSLEHDLVLARSDWVVRNDAFVLAEFPVDDVTIRAGAYSDLRWVPRSEYVGHQVGPIVAVTFERVDAHVPSISAFVRGGYYTHHGTRQDELTVLGGLSVDYDLGALR